MPISLTDRAAHHSAGLLIIRAIEELRVKCAKLPAWGGGNLTGWTHPYSDAWIAGCKAIMAEYHIDLSLLHEFGRQARTVKELT